ncbi:hypothetical protein [Luteibacter sp. ME-Dv--P-043b]|jgi:hypothetical protein|uniref:hypothetical protein n=1 Tax=Luteibacter sp. ME-Dv--P-043b TaxID=3040291 RepID=UPI00255323DF|nr:hypothetical protein [Luteibacter sp. ME-Dv--P-043b]
MTRDEFDQYIKPHLSGYVLSYSSFKGGDFGDIERVDLEGKSRIGGIDFWSEGWVGIHVVDLRIQEEVMNVMIGPDRVGEVPVIFDKLIKLLY